MFAQLRHRERRAGRSRSLFFWRDRTRDVDFVVESAGRLELFDAKWTELPGPSVTTNLEHVRRTVAPVPVASGAILCRAPHGYPLVGGFRAMTVEELG